MLLKNTCNTRMHAHRVDWEWQIWGNKVGRGHAWKRFPKRIRSAHFSLLIFTGCSCPSFTRLRENGGQIFSFLPLDRGVQRKKELKKKKIWNSSRSSSGRSKEKKKMKRWSNETSKTCYSIISFKLSLLKLPNWPSLFPFPFFIFSLHFFIYFIFNFRDRSSSSLHEGQKRKGNATIY